MSTERKLTVIPGGKSDSKPGSSYFSIGYKLVLVDQSLPYDLYINSSAVAGREKFVRIFPAGDTLVSEELAEFQRKYRQLYVSEKQRGLYLKSLCKIAGKNEVEKTTVIKDSAITYLGQLFDENRAASSEALNETITGCRDAVEGLVDVLQGYNLDGLQDLIGSLSFHDFYTYDHSINVSMYCILIYQSLKPGASREEIINAGFAGLLHDIGKMKIPTNIINKPGKLTPEEYVEIQRHPGLGYEILSDSGIVLPEGIDLGLLKNVVYQHHENFDGTGYPRKLSGNHIDLFARVTAIADFFDAITTKRSYHEVLSTEEALAVMCKTCGKKLDPRLFEFFAKQTKTFNVQKQTIHEVPQDFDPCQPPDPELWVKKNTEIPRTGEMKPAGFGKVLVKVPAARKR